MSRLATTLAALSMIQAASSYLVLTPSGPMPLLASPDFNALHNINALRSFPSPWPMHALSPPSHRPYKTWPSYDLAPRLPSVHDLLADMSLRVKQAREAPSAPEGWQDLGERVERTFSLPRGFEDKAAALSAALEDGMDKVTVQGSRAGLRFSRSLALPFELQAESDIEVEHKPQSGLLTLRLRKPEQEPPPQPTVLSIKRIEEAAPPAMGADAAAAARQEQEQAAPESTDAAAAEPRKAQPAQSEQQALDEKFAFVKEAEAPKAAAEPEAE